jgi:hypothetical protein
VWGRFKGHLFEQLPFQIHMQMQTAAAAAAA